MRKLFAGIATLLAFVGGILATAVVSASTFGSGNFGSCQFGSCSITLSTDGNVSLNISPTGDGRCTIQSDTVSVQTDSSNGYSLTLTSSTNDTDLENGAETITATTATFASPAALPANQWGYRVDDLGSFGPGPTTAVTDGPLSSLDFAGIVPISSSAAVLANTTKPASIAEETTVWYGVCANLDTVAGTYSAEAMYTAVTN